MKLPFLLAALALSAPALAAPHPFSSDDLVRLERVSDPQLAPDGKTLVYALRQTDFEANKGVNSLWRLDPQAAEPKPTALTDPALGASGARWSADGRALYFLAAQDGVQQLWRVSRDGGTPQTVSDLPLDVNAYALAPDGRHVALAIDVFLDCKELACSKARLDETAASKTSGVLYPRLFVRHWDTWNDGRRSQLFVAELGKDGTLGTPVAVSAGLDADIPSKPFGDASEFSFAPDSKTIVFSARVQPQDEAWSTNFDLYRAPVDGKTPPQNLTAANKAWDTAPVFAPNGKALYYLAMQRPGFEADRFAVMAMDLANGKTRAVAPDWDRSAGGLSVSADGKTLYATADELGQHKLFAIDIKTGKTTALTGDGDVGGYSVAAGTVVYAQDDLDSPAQLYRLAAGGDARQLTQINAERLAGLQFCDYTQFAFEGAGGDTVHGYVVKPVGFEAGKKYPVAFIIHGGPQGSMGNHFHYRWNPQTYAGAGYAVVFIDFHGSTGYGQAFTDAISQDWGGKPLTDLQKGWAYAQQTYPFLDSDRACALGASYGGYMINWIAGNWPDAFQCLVNHDGLFDNRSMYYGTEELWFPEWEHGGPYYANPEGHEKFNPANYVKNWKTPMLVIHGGKDFRVPLEQGLSTFTALQRRGIPSEFLYYPDENHWVLKPQNSVQWHQTVEAWLARWLGSGGGEG